MANRTALGQFPAWMSMINRRLREVERAVGSLPMGTRGRFTDYTPDISGINLAANSSVDGRYMRVGNMVAVKLLVRVAPGSESPGVIGFATPVGGIAGQPGFVYPMGVAIARAEGSAGSNVFKGHVTNGDSGPVDRMRVVSSGATSGGTWGSGTPFAWANGGWLSISAWYEAS